MSEICLTSAKDNLINNKNDLIEKSLSGIARGDKSALEELYALTDSIVFGYTLSILKNRYDAEDAMHDCYVCIFKNAFQYTNRSKPLAWILTIARNICYQKLRENKKRADYSNELLENKESVNAPFSIEDKTVLHACMKSLGDEERQIVVLHGIAGFKHREIAKIMEKPLATVLSKYNRAIKKLKMQLEREEAHDESHRY